MPTIASGSSAQYNHYLDGSILSTSVGNNQTTVRYRYWIRRTTSSGNGAWGTQTFRIGRPGGNTDASQYFDFRSAQDISVLVWDQTLTHDANGNYTINASFTGPLGGHTAGFPEVSGWGSWTLPTIPRATTPAWSGSSTFDAGSAKTLNLPRANSSFTHDVTYQFGTATGTIATGTGVTASWTPPLSLLNQIPNATSGTGTVTVVTKNGGTTIGTKTLGFTLTAPASVKPTISALTVTDDNPTVVSQIGGYVQGQSLLKVVATAAGIYGSTITSKQVVVDGVTAAEGTPILLANSGTRAVSAAVTDSRARIGTLAGTVTVLPYSTPTVDFTVARSDSGGTETETGTSLKVTLSAAVQSLIVGTQKNNLTIRVFTRQRGTTPWTARNVINHGSLTYNDSFVISGGANYPITNSFDVRVTVADKLQTSEDVSIVPTSRAFIDIYDNKVAVLKMVESGGPDVQIGGPARVYGALTVDGALTGAAATFTSASVNGSSVLRSADLATTTEAKTATSTTKAVTPAGLAGLRVRVGKNEATSGDQTVTTLTEVTGSSVPFTLANASEVVYDVTLSTYSAAAGDIVSVKVRDNSTVIQQGAFPSNAHPTAPGATHTHTMTGTVELPAGSHRLNFTVEPALGANVTVSKTADTPAVMVVDRIL